MIRIFIFTFLFTVSLPTNSQQLYLETGKSISSFRYKNSSGEKLENLQSSVHIYLSIGARKKIFSNKLFLNFSVNYNGYGASGSDNILDNHFDWDLNYLGLGLGLDYQLFKVNKFSLYAKAQSSLEIMLQGTQTLNNQEYDLKNEEDFNSPFYFLRAGAGANYKISDGLDFFAQYMIGSGYMFNNKQGELNIHEHRIGLGIYFSITKKKTLEKNNSVDILNLEALEAKLDQQNKKIEVLENAQKEKTDTLNLKLADKVAELKTMKDSISDVLKPYKGNDLTISENAGKIYISLDNDMLFHSGSSTISKEGVEALHNLSKILAENKNLNILIVGHTDNVLFKNTSMNNWDLSVQRATTVVEILSRNSNIDPRNLTAAGKGDLEPIADNSTEAGRKKNRRIDIIITPNLELLSEIIKK